MSAASSPLLPASAAYDVKYCTLCDAYFYSLDMLRDHIQGSSRHPRCSECDKRFLNNNSLRNHYVLSTRHHYCRICQKHFKTDGGFQVHLELVHGESDDEDDELREFPDDWEDRIARERYDALYGSEIPLPAEDLRAKPRPASQPTTTPKAGNVFRPQCPICLCRRKKTVATRCGHVFCSRCIRHAMEQASVCPTCRQPALLEQLRSLKFA
ncbi:unnamed protein product [Mycena citricolor]|uniref:RING-type domain-containing protein n=1 Tax=Mycena citricolor TaxID=2018698 RepID=A0AAD2Q1M1_9AGAR|nr:unnamed protein product [Mycena citricolor]